jgi:hypothetical protein|nr:MAG TPA: hypothetical protein [Caudoviricetes sp.]
MRKLIGKDAFTVARIIKKSGLKDNLDAIQVMGENPDYTKLGIKIFMVIVEGCANKDVDKEVFAFLDDILEVKNTDKMDLFELIELIKEYAEENDLKRFLSLVGSTI